MPRKEGKESGLKSNQNNPRSDTKTTPSASIQITDERKERKEMSFELIL